MNSLHFLTWNLNLLQRSSQAPFSWRMDQTEAEIRKCVLDLDPDLVCFQELPGMVPFIETHDLVPGNTTSHSGSIAAIVRHELVDQLTCQVVGRFAIMMTLPETDLTIANVHLEPTRQGKSKRLAMLEALLQRCPTQELLVVGDTNTRVSEEPAIQQRGLLVPRPPRPTWDNKRNRFADPDEFDSLPPSGFTAYYTRCFHTAGLSIDRLEVVDEPTVAEGQSFFLSDHFPLAGRVSW